jgi:hypothetical protein
MTGGTEEKHKISQQEKLVPSKDLNQDLQNEIQYITAMPIC